MTENTSLALQGMTTANTMTEHLYIKEAAMLRTWTLVLTSAINIESYTTQN